MIWKIEQFCMGRCSTRECTCRRICTINLKMIRSLVNLVPNNTLTNGDNAINIIGKKRMDERKNLILRSISNMKTNNRLLKKNCLRNM